MAKINDDRNVVIEQYWPVELIYSYYRCFLLLSAVKSAKPELGMNRSIEVRKAKMYLHVAEERKKTKNLTRNWRKYKRPWDSSAICHGCGPACLIFYTKHKMDDCNEHNH